MVGTVFERRYGAAVWFTLGCALIVVGVVVAALQVRWAARSTTEPLQVGRIDQHLSPRTRAVSNTAVVGSFVVGALMIAAGQPLWVRCLVAIPAIAAAVAVQAVAIRTVRRAGATGR